MYFTPFSGVFIVDFEQVYVSWESKNIRSEAATESDL